MQLTNYGFIDTWREVAVRESGRHRSLERMSSGRRLNHPQDDAGALSMLARARMEARRDELHRSNLQNFVSYLDVQRGALHDVRRMYTRMSILAERALDVGITSTERSYYNQEFVSLQEELGNLIESDFNGQRLFGGRNADFTEGLQDRNDFTPTDMPKMESIDVGTTSGTLTLEISPGGAEDQFWVFQGELPDNLQKYFQPSGVDNRKLTQELYDLFGTQGIFTTGPWQTYKSSGHEYYDKFDISFAPNCGTNVVLTPHALNQVGGTGGGSTNTSAQNYGGGETSFASNNKYYGNDLWGYLQDVSDTSYAGSSSGPLLRTAEAPGDSTVLTVVAINYSNKWTYEVKAAFEPTLSYNDIEIPVDGSGATNTYPAVSFSRVDCTDISTVPRAQSALKFLGDELENLTGQLAANAASRNRYVGDIDRMELRAVAQEYGIGALDDLDYATESIRLNRHVSQLHLATDMMARVARFSEVLTPLVTQSF